MSTAIRIAVAGAVMALLAGSVALAIQAIPQEQPVHHVAICWLKNPGDAAARAAVIEATHTLRAIPGVESVQVGEVIPSERTVVDSSFDVGIVLTFSDRQALADYAGHPIHQQALETTIKPLVARYLVYDFQE